MPESTLLSTSMESALVIGSSDSGGGDCPSLFLEVGFGNLLGLATPVTVRRSFTRGLRLRGFSGDWSSRGGLGSGGGVSSLGGVGGV